MGASPGNTGACSHTQPTAGVLGLQTQVFTPFCQSLLPDPRAQPYC